MAGEMQGNANEQITQFIICVTNEAPPVSRCCSPHQFHKRGKEES